MLRFPCGSRSRIALTCGWLAAALAVPVGNSAKTLASQAPAEAIENGSSSATASAAPAPQYESSEEAMFCEGFDRGGNDDKRIPDAALRARYEGNYGNPDDPLRTWNIETICHDALFAVPLFADVSPPLLEPTGENAFRDSLGSKWTFVLGADGKAESVTYVDPQGTITRMKRLGDPKSLY